MIPHYNTSIISDAFHRRCVVFAATSVTKTFHESVNNPKPRWIIDNIMIDRSHVGFEGMFVNVYIKGGKEWEHDWFYVQFDSPVTTLELSLDFLCGW